MRKAIALLSTLTAISVATCVSSCGSVRSKAGANPSVDSGMAYRLAKKRLVIKLVVSEKGQRTATADVTSAFGDPSTLIVASVPANQAFETKAEIRVNASGLLSGTQKSEIELPVTRLFETAMPEELAKSAGTPEDGSKSVNETITECLDIGEYTFTYDLEEDIKSTQRSQERACGFHLDKKRVACTSSCQEGSAYQSNLGKYKLGFFYRLPNPYVVDLSYYPTITAKTMLKTSTVLVAPTEKSPVLFVPIPRSVFAQNTTSVTFSDGFPTELNVNRESEWLGIINLPAAVLARYSVALTAGFTNRTKIAAENVQYLDQMNSLAVAQQKAIACAAELAKEHPDSSIVTAVCTTGSSAH